MPRYGIKNKEKIDFSYRSVPLNLFGKLKFLDINTCSKQKKIYTYRYADSDHAKMDRTCLEAKE